MENKKHILVCIDWYLPGYKAGGPIRSCANIVAALKDDFYFSVITSDTDFSDETPYSNIKSNSWNFTEDGTRVYYFSKQNLSFNSISKVIAEEKPDILYMNSFFSEQFTLFPLLYAKGKIPHVIIAPRGMLGKGALELKSFKKKIFIRLMIWLGAYKNVRWHASTPQEEKEIKNVLGKKAEVHVALNLSSIKIVDGVLKNKVANELKMVFFSRVSQKKNLHLMLELLKKVNSNFKIIFDIYGTLEDNAYWQQCEKLMAELPAHIIANYKGVVASEKIPDVFLNYHVSILPTMHENYGHSIVESFAQGVPVIISDQTPWKNLYGIKAGWDFALKIPDKFLHAIESCAEMNQETYNQWQQGALNYAQKILYNDEVLKQNKLLFKF
jgi:glycosyltransferase involved in cell wall biosynthesis